MDATFLADPNSLFWAWAIRLAALFVVTEATMFVPLLAYGWARGWWLRLRHRMNQWMGLPIHAKCPHCRREFEL